MRAVRLIPLLLVLVVVIPTIHGTTLTPPTSPRGAKKGEGEGEKKATTPPTSPRASTPTPTTGEGSTKCPVFAAIEQCIQAGKKNVYISAGALSFNIKGLTGEPSREVKTALQAQREGSFIDPAPDCILAFGKDTSEEMNKEFEAHCSGKSLTCFAKHEFITLKECCGQRLSSPVKVLFADYTFGDVDTLAREFQKGNQNVSFMFVLFSPLLTLGLRLFISLQFHILSSLATLTVSTKSPASSGRLAPTHLRLLPRWQPALLMIL